MTETNAGSSNSRFGILSVTMMFVPALTIIIMNVIVLPLMGKLPDMVERISLLLFAFLPPLLGFIFAILGLVKKERRKWLHVIGLVFNLLQTLYFGVFALLAG